MPEIYTNNERPRHSDEVNEIITRVPSWILRWGLTVFFVVLLGVVGFSALIDCPNIIRATVKIKTTHPDTKINCNAVCRVIKVFVNAGDKVRSGQIVAYTKYNDSTIHTLTSPAQGKLFYNGIVRPGEVIDRHSEIFYVEPDSPDFYGEMVIPTNHITEIHKGQTVLIKLKNYPFEQYGVLHGTIKYISSVDGTDIVVAEIELNKITLQLKPGMRGDAEIITGSSSIMHKMMGDKNRAHL